MPFLALKATMAHICFNPHCEKTRRNRTVLQELCQCLHKNLAESRQGTRIGISGKGELHPLLSQKKLTKWLGLHLLLVQGLVQFSFLVIFAKKTTYLSLQDAPSMDWRAMYRCLGHGWAVMITSRAALKRRPSSSSFRHVHVRAVRV